MDKTKTAKELLSKKETRILLCSQSFKYYLLYYFSQDLRFPELAPYHHDWMDSILFNLYIQ
jgi:hypothetical protein